MWNSLRLRIGFLVLASQLAVIVSVVAMLTLDDASSQHAQLARTFSFGALSLAGTLAIALSYLSLRQFVAPLRILTEMVERIARGDYQAAETPIGGAREIEQLRFTLDHMAREVRAGKEAQQFYIARLTNAQEEERAHLSRELHDDTIQSLIALGEKASNLRQLVGSEDQVGKLSEALCQSTLRLTDSVRQIASSLRPPYMHELGLVHALRELADEFGAGFSLDGQERRFDDSFEISVYRIVQQALRNTSQHAHAQHISVKVSFLAEELGITIEDDGSGFDVPTDLTVFARTRQLGLMGMQERARLLRGSVKIESQTGQGTEVVVRVPLTLSLGPAS